MIKPMLFPHTAISLISSGFLSGAGVIQTLDDVLVPIDEDTSLKDLAGRVHIDYELLAHLAREVERCEFGEDNELDCWLAPRLHYALRIPRRLASDARFWTWLAVTVFRSYVQRRWFDKKRGEVRLYRYVDNNMNLRNGVSRLWWGAEMTRNGADYGPVLDVFAKVRTAQFALELAYSAFKPAAIAFARVAVNSKPELNDYEKRRLSTMLRAYLSTTSLEMLGHVDDPIVDRDDAWRAHQPTIDELTGPLADLSGPNDGVVSESSIAALETWMKSLAEGIRNSDSSS